MCDVYRHHVRHGLIRIWMLCRDGRYEEIPAVLRDIEASLAPYLDDHGDLE